MAALSKIDIQTLEKEVQELSRNPFKEALTRFLLIKPTQTSIRKFANKYPDKWATAIANLARSAGYTEGTQTEINIYQQINNMSDAALQHELQEIQMKLKEKVIPDQKSEAIPAPKEVTK